MWGSPAPYARSAWNAAAPTLLLLVLRAVSALLVKRCRLLGAEVGRRCEQLRRVPRRGDVEPFADGRPRQRPRRCRALRREHAARAHPRQKSLLPNMTGKQQPQPQQARGGQVQGKPSPKLDGAGRRLPQVDSWAALAPRWFKTVLFCGWNWRRLHPRRSAFVVCGCPPSLQLAPASALARALRLSAAGPAARVTRDAFLPRMLNGT